ncbi:MAG: cytochrome c maturation protein CcmE [Proteobacteria bacterium]|nr:cytochrome c maturation protein CcmE [Pseudomonadota bacterium]
MGKKNKKLKVIVVSSILFSIIGYLTYTGIRDTMAYYLTVSELLAKGPSTENTGFRVGGEVIPDSIQWNPKDLKLSFRIREGESSLHVDYQGVLPDSFKPGREVIVEGRYTAEGLFKATTIMPTCPSKYE